MAIKTSFKRTSHKAADLMALLLTTTQVRPKPCSSVLKPSDRHLTTLPGRTTAWPAAAQHFVCQPSQAHLRAPTPFMNQHEMCVLLVDKAWRMSSGYKSEGEVDGREELWEGMEREDDGGEPFLSGTNEYTHTHAHTTHISGWTGSYQEHTAARRLKGDTSWRSSCPRATLFTSSLRLWRLCLSVCARTCV